MIIFKRSSVKITSDVIPENSQFLSYGRRPFNQNSSVCTPKVSKNCIMSKPVKAEHQLGRGHQIFFMIVHLLKSNILITTQKITRDANEIIKHSFNINRKAGYLNPSVKYCTDIINSDYFASITLHQHSFQIKDHTNTLWITCMLSVQPLTWFTS